MAYFSTPIANTQQNLVTAVNLWIAHYSASQFRFGYLCIQNPYFNEDMGNIPYSYFDTTTDTWVDNCTDGDITFDNGVWTAFTGTEIIFLAHSKYDSNEDTFVKFLLDDVKSYKDFQRHFAQGIQRGLGVVSRSLYNNGTLDFMVLYNYPDKITIRVLYAGTKEREINFILDDTNIDGVFNGNTSDAAYRIVLYGFNQLSKGRFVTDFAHLLDRVLVSRVKDIEKALPDFMKLNKYGCIHIEDSMLPEKLLQDDTILFVYVTDTFIDFSDDGVVELVDKATDTLSDFIIAEIAKLKSHYNDIRSVLLYVKVKSKYDNTDYVLQKYQVI